MQRGVGRGRTHSMHQPSALARNTSSGVTCTDHVTQTLLHSVAKTAVSSRAGLRPRGAPLPS